MKTTTEFHESSFHQIIKHCCAWWKFQDVIDQGDIGNLTYINNNSAALRFTFFRNVNKTSLKFIPELMVDSWWALVQVMAWCWIGDKPLPEPMIQFLDRHWNIPCQLGRYHAYWWPGDRLNIKTLFPGMGIPMLKIRRLWDRLIFNMGIPILVRRHLWIERALRLLAPP